MSVSEEIRDDLITHDVNMRRMIGGQQRLTLARQKQLEQDVVAAIVSIDVEGVSGPKRREARLKKLTLKVAELTNEAYVEHSAQNRATLRQVTRIESDAVTTALADSVV